MTRPFIKLPIFVLLIIISVGFAIYELSPNNSPNIAVRGFIENCESKLQPCWYGITLGKTTIKTAQTMLQNEGFHESDEGILPFGGGGYSFGYKPYSGTTCGTSLRHYLGAAPKAAIETDTVDEIMLFDCPAFMLGDLISVVGEPEGIRLGSTRMGNQRMLLMNNESTLVGVADFSSPDVKVNSIFIFPAKTYDASPSNWHGFNTKAAYCQMPDVSFPPCECQTCTP